MPNKLPVYVDFAKLKAIAIKPTHAINAETTSIVLNEYINLMANMLSTAKHTDEKQLALLTICLQDWLLYNNSKPTINPDFRAICMANLGNVYNPEAAYEHPVIILEKIPNEDLVLVVPTKSSAYDIAYDPISNPNGNRYVIKADKSNNFDGNCGIELKQLRIISTSRIISAKSKIDPAKYQEIKDRLVELYFPKHSIKSDLISDDLSSIIKKFTINNVTKLIEIKELINKTVNEYISTKSST